MAIGIKATMINALNIKADIIADLGDDKCIIFSEVISGIVDIISAGKIAKYFATSLAKLNVVNAPLVINNCLPIFTTSINFVGFESKSIRLAASLALIVPES